MGAGTARRGDEEQARDRGDGPTPEPDTAADTGVEGGVDAPNEDVDVEVEGPGGTDPQADARTDAQTGV